MGGRRQLLCDGLARQDGAPPLSSCLSLAGHPLTVVNATMQVKVWTREGSEWSSVASLRFDEAATSIAASFVAEKRYVDLPSPQGSKLCSRTTRSQAARHCRRPRERRSPPLHRRARLACELDAFGEARFEVRILLARSPLLSGELTLAPTGSIAHVLAVTTLAFCPRRPSSSVLRLASGSDDHSVRIFDVEV